MEGNKEVAKGAQGEESKATGPPGGLEAPIASVGVVGSPRFTRQRQTSDPQKVETLAAAAAAAAAAPAPSLSGSLAVGVPQAESASAPASAAPTSPRVTRKRNSGEVAPVLPTPTPSRAAQSQGEGESLTTPQTQRSGPSPRPRSARLARGGGGGEVAAGESSQESVATAKNSPSSAPGVCRGEWVLSAKMCGRVPCLRARRVLRSRLQSETGAAEVF